MRRGIFIVVLDSLDTKVFCPGCICQTCLGEANTTINQRKHSGYYIWTYKDNDVCRVFSRRTMGQDFTRIKDSEYWSDQIVERLLALSSYMPSRPWRITIWLRPNGEKICCPAATRTRIQPMHSHDFSSGYWVVDNLVILLWLFQDKGDTTNAHAIYVQLCSNNTAIVSSSSLWKPICPLLVTKNSLSKPSKFGLGSEPV